MKKGKKKNKEKREQYFFQKTLKKEKKKKREKKESNNKRKPPIKHRKQIEARSGALTIRVLDFRVGGHGCTLQNTDCHYYSK